MLKLYDCDTAPSPRRTRILLAEKGIEFEKIQVDLRNNEQLGPAYQAINPRCSVPFLITEEGDGISENTAIAVYLEAIKPEPSMLGTNALERARVFEWNARIEFDAFTSVQEVLRNKSAKLKGRALPGPIEVEQIPALVERGRSRLLHFYDEFDRQLAHDEYVAGERFSLADITALVAIEFSSWVKLPPDDSKTNIGRWLELVRKRPSYGA